MPYNFWIQRRLVRKLKNKCKFVLYEDVGGGLGKYHQWSEVYWSDDAFDDHDHVTYDDLGIITWTMPEDCHIDGFCIIHDDEGTLVTQRINYGAGINLFTGEMVHVDISGIYVVLP